MLLHFKWHILWSKLNSWEFYDSSHLFHMEFDTSTDFKPRLYQLEKYVKKRLFVSSSIRLDHE